MPTTQGRPFHAQIIGKTVMCIILFAFETHPEYRLILASNRDEYFDRPTAPADFWEEAPNLLAGRDLKEGGTWLGITKSGRFGALTNYRDPPTIRKDAPSRGGLVSDFLMGKESAADFLKKLHTGNPGYNGFNLLIADHKELYFYSNRGDGPERLSPGVYALSNRLLDTPWPKVVRGKKTFEEVIRGDRRPSSGPLFQVLSDRTPVPDRDLPHTGVTLEWERVLSPIFVASPDYGTRASTLLFVDRDEKIQFKERTFGPEGVCQTTRHFEFRIRRPQNG